MAHFPELPLHQAVFEPEYWDAQPAPHPSLHNLGALAVDKMLKTRNTAALAHRHITDTLAMIGGNPVVENVAIGEPVTVPAPEEIAIVKVVRDEHRRYFRALGRDLPKDTDIDEYVADMNEDFDFLGPRMIDDPIPEAHSGLAFAFDTESKSEVMRETAYYTTSLTTKNLCGMGHLYAYAELGLREGAGNELAIPGYVGSTEFTVSGLVKRKIVAAQVLRPRIPSTP
ncbi:MAG TPA: hypothetical protein VK983_01640 [Candidatus Limnocylindrales bacterium]|nr:hypothetical protein [Candidatus Limnocylindrales bacterium]